MATRERRTRLAVIGGGQAAKAILFAVAEAAAAGRIDWRGTTITVYERGSEFGTGLAWSRSFALDEHVSSLSSPQPRVVYGDGQRRQFAGCVAMLGELGLRVALRPDTEIVALERAGPGWRLRPAGAAPDHADAAVLATGHWDPQEPVVAGALRPWPARALQEAVLGGGGRVLVIGTGLTAIDAAVTLALGAGRFEPRTDGHLDYRRARPLGITLASRGGCLPGVWGAPPLPLPDFEAALRARFDGLHAAHGRLPLAAALDAVAEAAHGHAPARVAVDLPALRPGVGLASRIAAIRAAEARWAADPLATLAADLAAIAPQEGPIASGRLRRLPVQAVALATLPLVSEAFHALDFEDHAMFQACLRGPFYRRAMPMGFDSALRLSALARAGCLRVARLDPLLPPRRRPDERWVLPVRAGPPDLFDHVVDGIGQRADLATRTDPLWKALFRDRRVRPALRPRRDGTMGATGGVDVDPATRRVRADCAGPPLYATGALTLGLFVDAQGIGHLMRDAARIVADLDAQGFPARAALPAREGVP